MNACQNNTFLFRVYNSNKEPTCSAVVFLDLQEVEVLLWLKYTSTSVIVVADVHGQHTPDWKLKLGCALVSR